MDKTASLHSINLKKLPLFESDSNDKFVEIINSNVSLGDYKMPDSPYILTISEKTDTFVFGSFGKCKDPKDNPLMRLRKQSSYDVIDTKDIDFVIEDYCYFYFELENLRCIYTSSTVRNFKSHFIDYLKNLPDMGTYYEQITLIPIFESRLEQALDKMTSVSSIQFKDLEHKNLSQKNVNSITNAMNSFYLSSDHIKDIIVTVNFKDFTAPNLFTQLKQNITNRTIAKIKGKNEINSELILDVVSQELTKKINIILKEKSPTKEDLIHIRETLQQAIIDLL